MLAAHHLHRDALGGTRGRTSCQYCCYGLGIICEAEGSGVVSAKAARRKRLGLSRMRGGHGHASSLPRHREGQGKWGQTSTLCPARMAGQLVLAGWKGVPACFRIGWRGTPLFLPREQAQGAARTFKLARSLFVCMVLFLAVPSCFLVETCGAAAATATHRRARWAQRQARLLIRVRGRNWLRGRGDAAIA